MVTARTAIGLLAVLAALACACTPVRADELTLYSTREANLVEPVVAAFTATTGTKVKTVFVEDSLVKRLTSEGDNSPADVLLSIGLDKTTQLAARGLTQAHASPALDQAMPANLRGGNGQWIALTIRPRVVFARKDSPLAAITYEELADPRWRGKLCMRPAAHQNNVALIAAYLTHHGTDATQSWLAGLKANLARKPTGKDNDVVREIAEGRCEIGIGNTVALAQLRDGREGNDWRAWADAVKAVPTAFAGGGSHVNLTGAAIARHA
ncbi:substrate-binding domain-containing protein, partial [Rudaea sp.]|uniref:substrate-binding domain-containing protein n=1 Tax=Rudaea sp. TaxID=2136325 RepID=UPI002ECFBE1E